MAKNKSTVYLGYDDEEITAKQAAYLNSSTNKIGGTPNWPRHEVTVPACPLCGMVRPLIVQMYAPLDRSQFHRNLYVFACVSPACSPNQKSWVCVRTQHLDNQFDVISEQSPKLATNKQNNKKKHKSSGLPKVNWCSGADDWGWGEPEIVDEAMDLTADDEQNERNGNVRPSALQYVQPDDDFEGSSDTAGHDIGKVVGENDDDDDESTSVENDLVSGFGQIDMNSPEKAGEDPNANCAAAVVPTASADGAGAAATAIICAEIEGSETDVVLVDTPKKPERDLIALLKHTSLPATLGPLSQIKDLTLRSIYIAVDVEANAKQDDYENYGGLLSMDHIRDLYQEYKLQDENPSRSPVASAAAAAAGGGGGNEAADEQETYEKALPAHGDLVFHNFITTIQQNPGQILRYSRDAHPLLVAPLNEPLPKCQNCKGDTICEVQLLPTLIPKLRFQQNSCNAPIEYGNVLVFTCLKSCWDTPDQMRYEHVVVQSET
ncbi:programmed cell death protein 2-like [Drosophila grimshawi]|uniref:GH18538 n=1 Tax=Drosophila grimshawi TaxID=7222 RepID=B4JI84_DROGR|nr:programmed cell death protein 2-like [Drosophila grimshawi]EDV92965.1 GH18538 [Drosophila grimshawi]